MSATATEAPPFKPDPPPRTSAGGRQPGGSGPFRIGFIDFDLCPFLAKVGLGPAEILATVVALCSVKKDGDHYLLTWAEDSNMERSTVSEGAVQRAKKKLKAADLIDLMTPGRKKKAAVWDVTNLINAKGR